MKDKNYRDAMRKLFLSGKIKRQLKKRCPDCGHTKTAKHFRPSNLNKSGLTAYCTKCVRRQHNEYRRSHIGLHLVRTARTRAKAAGMACNLKRGDITVPSHCPVLGIPMAVGTMAMRRNSPTLDRIDNKKGYLRSNVIVVSYRANAIKQDATPDEIMKVAKFYTRLLKSKRKRS